MHEEQINVLVPIRHSVFPLKYILSASTMKSDCSEQRV